MTGFWQPFIGCARDGNRQAHRCALPYACKDLRCLEGRANAATLTTTRASAAKTGFACAVAQGGAGPKDYVPLLVDLVARANGIILLPRLIWQGPLPLPRPIRSTASGRRPKASVQPPPAPRRGLHPRPGRGRTVIHPAEPVLARRSAKARGKAVPFPVRANDGMAKIAVAGWLSSCNGRFVFLGPNEPLKHTNHQTDWGTSVPCMG